MMSEVTIRKIEPDSAWFTARRDHIDYLKRLRDRSDWPIAVEFRGGSG